MLTRCLAPLSQSIRTADDGLLSFQFMIPISGRVSKGAEAKFCFVEFLVSPLTANFRRVLLEAEELADSRRPFSAWRWMKTTSKQEMVNVFPLLLCCRILVL